MPCSREDIQLIQDLTDGKKESWDLFVERFSKLVYFSINKVIRSYTCSLQEEDIEDIYNGIFLSFIEKDYRKLRQFEGRSSLASWIRLISIRSTIDFLRVQKTEISIDDDTDETRPVIDTLHDRNPTAHEYIELSQTDKIVKESIEELPPSDRLFMELYYEKELPPEEIAEIMNVTVSTVYSKKNRVREKLKNILQKKGISARNSD